MPKSVDAKTVAVYYNVGIQVKILNVSLLVDLCLFQKDHHPFISQIQNINGLRGGKKKSLISFPQTYRKRSFSFSRENVSTSVEIFGLNETTSTVCHQK